MSQNPSESIKNNQFAQSKLIKLCTAVKSQFLNSMRLGMGGNLSTSLSFIISLSCILSKSADLAIIIIN